MKLIRWVFLFLLCMGITLFAFSFLAPDHQQVVRSVVINAPKEKVYRQMLLLQNFNSWSIWGNADSSIRYTPNSIPDGQIGTTITWNGNALLSGKGMLQLTGLKENKEIDHHISFLEPEKIEADSRFELTDENSATRVTWTFTVPSKKPWNIYNLFYSLDKEKGSEFEKGLLALKLMIEKGSAAAIPQISTVDFPLTNYVAVRQPVAATDLSAFFSAHFRYLGQNVLGDSAVKKTIALFYKKDEKGGPADVAAAIEIPSGTNPPVQAPATLISLPTSKGIALRIRGNYTTDKTIAYHALDDYITTKQLKVKLPVIEEYTTADSSVRIIYLVD
ncbi:MAG: SRPBCC family protein [Niabella sp.]|nr:SRPBCC family protein [Niabella sp.]